MGVRTNTPAADELVRRALAGIWVPGVDAPPNFSVSLELPDGSTAPTKRAKLNILYRSSSMVIRSRSPRRVVEGLASFMSSYEGTADQLLVSVDRAIVGRDQAILVPAALTGALETLDPRLRRKGWRFVDSLLSVIDADTGELVVRDPAVRVDPTAFDGVDDGAAGELPAVPPGRYPVARWILGAPGSTDMSRAGAVATAIRAVTTDPLGPALTLRALAKVFERTRPSPADLTAGDAEVLRVVATIG